MNIKIGFSYGNGILPKIIKFFTKSTVSHTFLLIDDKTVLEAGSNGFVELPFEDWKKDNNLVTLVNPIVPLDKGFEAAQKWIGEPYAYGALIGFIWVLIGRVLRRKFHNPFYERKALFCSEANTRIVKDSNWPGSDKLIPSGTSPQDLLTFVTK